MAGMAESFRVERDPLGDLNVPADAYYGVQTARAVENFPISGWCCSAACSMRRGSMRSSPWSR
jgi:aspartate ammonia-lyase